MIQWKGSNSDIWETCVQTLTPSLVSTDFSFCLLKATNLNLQKGANNTYLWMFVTFYFSPHPICQLESVDMLRGGEFLVHMISARRPRRNFFDLFSCSVVSNSLRPRRLQHARLPPSAPPRACSNSCPLSRWCHPTILSSVVPFSSCLQSFPASGSLPVSSSHLFWNSVLRWYLK